MNRLALPILALFSLSAINPATPPGRAASYQITDLGTSGYEESEAYAINSRGEVAGDTYDTTIAGCPGCFERTGQGYLWSNSRLINLDVSRTDLTGSARAINAKGQVVGSHLIPRSPGAKLPTLGDYVDTVTRAVLWRSGTLVVLGTLGGDDSVAWAINDAGEVVGGSDTATGQEHAFWDDHGILRDLGTLGGEESRAYGVNAAGQIVGEAETTQRRLHACLWSGGLARDLGTLGGRDSSAAAINDRGQAVGNADTATGHIHAFLWQSGDMKDLGTLGGMESRAKGLDNLGDVVGYSYVHFVPGTEPKFVYPIGTAPHAFLYRQGKMQDLNTLIPLDSGWTLVSANAINAAGQIVGTGLHNGETRAFLLTPSS